MLAAVVLKWELLIRLISQGTRGGNKVLHSRNKTFICKAFYYTLLPSFGSRCISLSRRNKVRASSQKNNAVEVNGELHRVSALHHAFAGSPSPGASTQEWHCQGYSTARNCWHKAAGCWWTQGMEVWSWACVVSHGAHRQWQFQFWLCMATKGLLVLQGGDNIAKATGHCFLPLFCAQSTWPPGSASRVASLQRQTPPAKASPWADRWPV